MALDMPEINRTVQPLDGGWAWMVVIGSGINIAICLGFVNAYSMIYQAILLRFQESDFKTSLCQTIFLACVCFTGKFVRKVKF